VQHPVPWTHRLSIRRPGSPGAAELVRGDAADPGSLDHGGVDPVAADPLPALGEQPGAAQFCGSLGNPRRASPPVGVQRDIPYEK
jgi:hypothetical protein